MTAIQNSLKTRAVGYSVLDEVFVPQSSYLPMRVALFGEPNTANVALLDSTPYQVTSAADAGTKYGFGSPIYQAARILLPVSGGGLGSIPLFVYPQTPDVAATATVIVLGVAVSTAVSKTTTHTLRINGRTNIDGVYYNFNVTSGGNVASVVSAITDCINNVLACPFTAVAGTGIVTLTSKWKGLTAADLNIEVLTNGDAASITYSETSNTAGTTTPSITTGLAALGNEWSTLVINTYGTAKLEEFEIANGSALNKNGRYDELMFKPFMALLGSVEDDKDDLVTITNASARKDQMTTVLCPAPNSKGMPLEAAANMAILIAANGNDTPQIGLGGKSYSDMPVPANGIIGDMSDVLNRNFCMTKGCSTVILENGKYTVQDVVTTFAPDGVVNPKFQHVRDIILDWNVGYNWKIIVIRDIQDKAVVLNDSAVLVGGTVSPKQIKALACGMFSDLQSLALINDVIFSNNSVTVSVNAGKLDIAFKYKRTSAANQIGTEAAVDFTYSQL
jgi:phage tail sheath gpL-like